MIYIQGSNNISADVLRRLDLVDAPIPVKNNIKSVNEDYGLENEDIIYPTDCETMIQN